MYNSLCLYVVACIPFSISRYLSVFCLFLKWKIPMHNWCFQHVSGKVLPIWKVYNHWQQRWQQRWWWWWWQQRWWYRRIINVLSYGLPLTMVVKKIRVRNINAYKNFVDRYQRLHSSITTSISSRLSEAVELFSCLLTAFNVSQCIPIIFQLQAYTWLPLSLSVCILECTHHPANR